MMNNENEKLPETLNEDVILPAGTTTPTELTVIPKGPVKEPAILHD